MTAHETKTFKSGNSVAIRLPKGFGFAAGTPVRLECDGANVIVRPAASEDPDEARRKLLQMLEDLDAIGRPGEVQEREAIRIEFPDRPGLY